MSGSQNYRKRGLPPISTIFLGAVLAVLGAVLPSSPAWAACSADIGKVTINEYNTLGSNNVFNSSYVEVKLLPGPAPLTTLPGWTLRSYTKTGVLLDTQTVASAGVGSCPGTPYRATALALTGDGYVHLLDASGNLADVVYVNVTPPATVLGCALSTITVDKDIQGAGSSRKNVSRDPDGTGNWIESLGSGNSSEQTVCASNRDLLGATKSASAATVYVGESVTFTMTVTNRTQFTTLTNVTLVDSLPVGFTRTGNTAPAGTSFNSATNTWTINSMAPGATYSLSLTARAGQVGNWINSATAYVTYSGYLYQSDPATASVSVLQPLTLTKTVSPSSVLYNTPATYTVTVTNNSTAALPAAFTVDDTLPAGVTAGTPTTSPGSSYSYSAGVWTINSGMAAGSSKTLTLPVTSQSTDGSFTNTATAVAPFGGTNLSASATLAVSSVAVSNFNAFETTTAAGAITGVIRTKIAGSAFSLDVVAINGGAQAASFTNSVKAELLANTGTPGSGYGADNCPTANSVIQTIAPTNISGGRSAVNFAAEANAYRDVRVRISYPTTSPTVSRCSTDSFAIRPNSFINVSVADTDWQTSGNVRLLTNINATGGNVHKAGRPFTLQATAVNAATPTTTTSNYTGTPGAALSACGGDACTATFGTFALGTGTAVAGVINSTTATYSEVGAFTLQLQDHVFASVDAADGTPANCAGQYVCSAMLNVGRFVPDHFAVSATPIVNRSDICPAAAVSVGCPATFTYMDEPMKAVFTLTAQSASNTTTQNYAGALAKLNPAAAGNPLVFGAVNSTGTPTYLTTRLNTSTVASGSFALGVANVIAPLAITRGATADGPYAVLNIGIAPVDSDNVIMSAYDLDTDAITGNDHTTIAQTEVRFGRLKLSNAHGSELLNLAVPFVAQYFNGTAFVTNTADNATQVLVPSVANGDLTKNPVGLATAATMNGIAVPSLGRFISGDGRLKFSKPNSTGSVDITIADTPDYLKYDWNSATAGLEFPSARATFGVYKGSSEIIDMRENH